MMWCEVSENVIGMDEDMDGLIGDEQDGDMPVDNGGSEDVQE